MFPALRFGIAVPQVFTESEPSVDVAVELARTAEADGLDSVWVQSQLVGRADVLEPLTLLSHIAAFTKRLRLGVAALAAAEHMPVQLAKLTSSVDRLSRGRLIVGLGLGADGTRLRIGGVDTTPLGPRLEEAVRLMRLLWTAEKVTFHGRFWQVDDVSMNPLPVQQPHPPLWICGSHPNAIRRSVRLGSGWVGPGAGPVDEFAQAVSQVHAELAAAGRARADFTVAKRVYVAVGNSSAARERMLQHFAKYARYPQRVLSASLCGPPGEIVEGLADVARAGAELAILNPVYDHLAQQAALMEVIHAYQSRSP